MKRRRQKKKMLSAYGKQYKGQCNKCGKYGYKSNDQKCLGNRNEDKDEKRSTKHLPIKKRKRNHLMENVFTVENMSIELMNARSMVRKQRSLRWLKRH